MISLPLLFFFSFHLIVFILGCFHLECVWFLHFLYLLLGIHPSIHPLDVSTLCVCFFSPFFFICFLVFVHPFIPWMFSPCVCSFFSPFFFFRFLVFIHPSLDVFTLCAHVRFCLLFSISLLVCFHSSLDFFIHPSAPPAAAAALEDSTTAPLVLLLLVLSARKSWAKKF